MAMPAQLLSEIGGEMNMTVLPGEDIRPRPRGTRSSGVTLANATKFLKETKAYDGRTEAARMRATDLRIFLARLEGFRFADAARLLRTSAPLMRKWVHGEAIVPPWKKQEIERLSAVVRNVQAVIDAQHTSAWFRTEIPGLGGRSPMACIEKGRLSTVVAYTARYVDRATYS